MLSRLLAILKLMGKNRYLRNVVAPMKDKFGDNWSIIQMFYSFAFFFTLDSRTKERGLSPNYG